MRGQTPRWRRPTAERLDQLLALPMLVLTLVFLVVMILPVIYPGLPHEARAAMAAIDVGIWAAFLAEYLARLFVAPDRFRFIIRNPFDLLLVVIPVLRPLRLLAFVSYTGVMLTGLAGDTSPEPSLMACLFPGVGIC